MIKVVHMMIVFSDHSNMQIEHVIIQIKVML